MVQFGRCDPQVTGARPLRYGTIRRIRSPRQDARRSGAIAARLNQLAAAASKGTYLWGIGLLGGLANGISAWMQGAAGAAAADAMGETGKGFGNYLITIGIIETVALFVMVFSLMAIGKIAG